MSIMDKISNRNLYEFERTEPSLYSFSFLFEEITSLEELFVKINIDTEKYQISLFFNFLRNGLPYSVRDKTKRLLLAKYFLKMNRFLKGSNFTVNPLSGEFILILNNYCTPQQFDYFLFEPSKFITYLNTELKRGKNLIEYYLNNMRPIF